MSATASSASSRATFSAATVAQVQPRLEALRELDPAGRFPVLLDVPTTLARDTAPTTLATHAFAPSTDKVQERLSRVLDRLHADPAAPPPIERLAGEAALSVGAFHRFFKRHTGMTV